MGHPTRRQAIGGLLAGSALLAFAPAALAQGYDIRFVGYSGGQLKTLPIAISSYQLTFFTQHQATASGSVEAKARLTTTLAGLDEPQLRRLTDAAHADLLARLAAAGIATAPVDQVRAAMATAGVQLQPDNAEFKAAGGGITIGKSIRKGYAAFGATDAPMIAGLHNPQPTTGFGGMGRMLGAFSAAGKVGGAARALKIIVLAPSLVLDFAKSDARSGGGSALVTNDLQFTLAATSAVTVMSSSADGRFATPGAMRVTKDHVSRAPFATLATGEGAVRALSTGGTWTDRNFNTQSSVRGDAAVIDKTAWETLVREAYGAFNGAVVAAIVKARA